MGFANEMPRGVSRVVGHRRNKSQPALRRYLAAAVTVFAAAAGCAYQRVAPLHSYPDIPPDVSAVEEAVTRAQGAGVAVGLAEPPAGMSRSAWLASWLDGPAGVIATPQERRQFEQLTADAQRERFVREFWRRRSADGAGEEFLAEFARRVRLADQLFGRPGVEGWRTVFGQVLLALGQPDRVEIVPPQLPVAGAAQRKSKPAAGAEAANGGGGLVPGAPAREGVAVIWHYGERLQLPAGERIPTLPYILGAVPFTFYGGFWRMACYPAYDATTRLGSIQDEPITIEHTRTLAAEGTFSRRIRGWHDVEACPAYDRRFLAQAARATLRRGERTADGVR